MSAAAAGSPAPGVQWQRLTAGVWTDVPEATSTTLTLTARLGEGTQYRAYFANAFGGVYTEPATLEVTESPEVVVPSPAPVVDPPVEETARGAGGGAQDGRGGALAATGADPAWIAVAGLLLVAGVTGLAAAGVARRGRRSRDGSALGTRA